EPRGAGVGARARAGVLRVSGGGPADVRAVDADDAEGGGLGVTLEIAGARATARLAFAGRHNTVNALCAAGVGHALGLPLAAIVAGLETARPVKGRCVWRQAGGIRILDAPYNANPPPG